MEIAVLIILTLASGFFSLSETALFSLPAVKVKSFQTDPNPRRRMIAQLIQRPRDLLVTVFMMNTLANILLQNVASHMFGSAAGWGLKVGVPLLLTLVFGEIIPKYIGLQNNFSMSYYTAPLINLFQRLLAPIRKFVIAIIAPISRGMFWFLRKEERISKEEMEHVLKTSEAHGVLDKDEAELVCGYLRFRDSMAKELMRPREEILFYDIQDPLTKLVYLFVDQQCTRLPVCDHDLDHILGVISARQFFLHKEKTPSSNDLRSILTKPFFVPESIPVQLLLRRLNEKRQELALVVDEYGSITGLITREDMHEIVIGEVVDLRDRSVLYTRSGEKEIIANGKLELAEFNELFDSSLESEKNMVTVGGWLIEQLGEIPKSGRTYEMDDFFFQVLSATSTRVHRLYIRKRGKP